MQKLCKATLALAISLLLAVSCCGTAFAAENTLLLTIGSKHLYANETLEQVQQDFGTPRLTTVSLFGGNAYTFYGENYADFLYLDTNAAGQITSYCTIMEGFQGTYSYGDAEDYYVHRGEFYYDYSKNDTLTAFLGYTDRASFTEEQWDAHRTAYSMAIWQHAVEMWNAITTLYGYQTPVTFDPRTFYTQMQLVENNSDLYAYCRATGSQDFQLVYTGAVSFFGYWYPNPLKLAQYAYHYTANNDGTPVFSFDSCQTTTVGFLNPAFFTEKTPVEYTDREKALLAAARQEYMDSVDSFNSAPDYFDVEPQYDTLPIQEGTINAKCLEGATGYLNAIRIAAGLDPLQLNEELAHGAQCKAALTMYLSLNGISNPSPHYPPQPEGVSDAFYALAQNGSGENLFMGDIIQGISNALEDSYGSGQYYSRGHRYNLLDPYWTDFGIGSSIPTGLSFTTQSAQKFSGYHAADVDLVAWPPAGIMPQEAGSTNMFTAKFFRNYTVTGDTTVHVTCLNSGQSWDFTDQSASSYAFRVSVGENMVSFYDSGITMSLGDVFEITLQNVQDNNQENLTDYTYRTVYESLYSSGEGEDNQVVVDKTQITLNYQDTAKINATLTSETAENRLVRFRSSNPDVVEVNENGFLLATGAGTAVITAYLDSGASTEVAVTVHRFVDGVCVDCGLALLLGDLNTDGSLSVTDVVLLRKAILNNDFQPMGDMNGDQALSVTDVVLLRKAILAGDS